MNFEEAVARVPFLHALDAPDRGNGGSRGPPPPSRGPSVRSWWWALASSEPYRLAAAVVEGFLMLGAHRNVEYPVDGRRATVRLEAGYTVLHSLFGHRRYRVAACSRWPGHARCGQLCLDALESAPRPESAGSRLAL